MFSVVSIFLSLILERIILVFEQNAGVVIISVSLISGVIIFGSDQGVGEMSSVVIISVSLISGVIIFGSDQEVGEMSSVVIISVSLISGVIIFGSDQGVERCLQW